LLISPYTPFYIDSAQDSGAGAAFDYSGGELELCTISITGEEPRLEGSLKTSARFASVAWTAYQGTSNNYPAGILAGGMADGTILLFDPAAIMAGKGGGELGTVPPQPSSGPVAAMKFSTLDEFNLCAGAYNGRVSIFDCTDPMRPVGSDPGAPGQQAAAEITAVAWNTSVAHIVATAAGDGTVTVWDVKAEKAWCEIRAEHAGQAVADLAWNPAQGLHLLTASADDRNPLLKVWDLGASTSVPLATLAGHSAGLFRAAWCPHDDSLLLSVGKDNRTLLWDLQTLAAVAELPMDAPEHQQQQNQQGNNNSAGALFASGRPGLQEQKQLRYDVQWSPFQRGVALTCSLDKKVQFHSLLAMATCAGRPPAWMMPASSVTTGFGGLLISCGIGSGSIVTIRTIQEQPKLSEVSQSHESEIAYYQSDIIEFCKIQQDRVTDVEDKALWGFMQVIFETNARQELLLHLGFNSEEVAAAAGKFSEEDLPNGDTNGLDIRSIGGMSQSAQDIVKKALLVGNYEAAVDCCFQTGNFADALMLASCGEAELWTKTQERFFESESSKRPYLSLLSSIVRNQLEDMANESDIKTWQETLAVLATYAQSEEFPTLCVTLGDRLLSAGNESSASLCYMCALNLERSVLFWKTQLRSKSSEDLTTTSDLLALHDFVVKVSVFNMAAGPGAAITPEIGELYIKYAHALAEQGLLTTATKFCAGYSERSAVLRDRLYRSRASQRCYAVLGSAPEFPYAMVDVQQSRGQVMAQPKVQPMAESEEPYEQHQHNAHELNQEQNQREQEMYRQEGVQGFDQAGSYGQQGASGHDHQLPPGWVALQDPTSGNPYYANQTTGETTWDMPQSSFFAPPAQETYHAPCDAGMDSSVRSQKSQRSQTTAQTATSMPKSTLVSKYGDGFVSSASNPALAYHYGNVGTANPYGGTERPGTAAAVVGGNRQSAPVSGSLNFDSLQLSNHHHNIKDTLLGLADALKGAALNPVEKRQLLEAEKGVAILVKKLAREGLGEESVQHVTALVDAVAVRDYATALVLQTTLANTEWKEHKDWLKGIKILLQLASKKLYQ
jgi:protein transport protein SEC31